MEMQVEELGKGYQQTQQSHAAWIEALIVENTDGGVYLFPSLAITDFHKLGGLKKQKSILSQFWWPEVNHRALEAMVSPVVI